MHFKFNWQLIDTQYYINFTLKYFIHLHSAIYSVKQHPIHLILVYRYQDSQDNERAN